MKDYFISGWCGAKDLFSEIPDNYKFMLPFLEDYVDDIETEISGGGKTLCGWSTGAHIILKNIKYYSSIFDNVVLVSPFYSFTDYTPEKILKIMIKKIKSAPEEVVRDFYKNCGIEKAGFVINFDSELLAQGLRFLQNSKIEPEIISLNNVYVIHGTKDFIVNVQSGIDVSKNLACHFSELDCGHFIDFSKISQVLNENIR